MVFEMKEALLLNYAVSIGMVASNPAELSVIAPQILMAFTHGLRMKQNNILLVILLAPKPIWECSWGCAPLRDCRM